MRHQREVCTRVSAVAQSLTGSRWTVRGELVPGAPMSGFENIPRVRDVLGAHGPLVGL